MQEIVVRILDNNGKAIATLKNNTIETADGYSCEVRLEKYEAESVNRTLGSLI